MKLAAKCAAAILSAMLILPVSGWGILHGLTPQSKEQNPPAKESREEYQIRILTKLDELNRQISDLEAKEETQADQARREVRKQLRQLNRQYQTAARQYEELKRESQETWEKMKPKMDTALDELEKAYRNLAARFQEK
jgi:chromosome segregation ATPase